MTTLYKLTDQQGRTRPGGANETQWGEGVTHTAPGKGALCTEAYIHAYTHPLLAVLLNPIGGNYEDPLIWESEGIVERDDHGLKVGCTSFTTLCQIPLPAISVEQRVRFAILCAKRVCNDPAWNTWADRWLDGTDRTAVAAEAAWAAPSAVAAAHAAAVAAGARAAVAAEAAAAAEAADGDPIDLIAIAEEAIS